MGLGCSRCSNIVHELVDLKPGPFNETWSGSLVGSFKADLRENVLLCGFIFRVQISGVHQNGCGAP
eukprot:15323735-Ditylum_brightwellii.AAC.1